MKNKKGWLGLIALVLAAALMLGVYLGTRPETEAGGKAFTVLVVHKDGGEKTFSYVTDAEYLGTGNKPCAKGYKCKYKTESAVCQFKRG